jgi:hypothetical protein
MSQPKCQICDRPPENLNSIACGIGLKCLAKRERFLAAAGLNDHGISALTLCGAPTALRWIRMIGKALGSGHQDHVNRFIEAALRASELAQMPNAA